MRSVGKLSRRELLSRGSAVVGWGAFFSVLGTGAIETVRFFFPRVLFHPPSTFTLGVPEEFLGNSPVDAYGVISVDERWKKTQRFFVVRDQNWLYAFFARCPHLGCTVNWFPDLRVFKCPCHGSEFYSSGRNFAGPAPRPLDRLKITLDMEGRLVVDTSVVYTAERFSAPGAYVAL